MSSIRGAQFEADLPADTHGQPAAPPRARLPEADLMARAGNGDRAAYGQIVELLQDRLFNAMLRMVGDPEDARELTQESFTRGLEKIDSFRGESSPYTWLFRIAMNLAIGNLRKAGRRRVFSLYGDTSGRSDGDGQAALPLDRLSQHREESPAAAAERAERQQAVVAALGRLDAESRAVLVMRDIEGFDYQQMADVLSMPLGTLKSRLFRARLALRDELVKFMAESRGRPGDKK